MPKQTDSQVRRAWEQFCNSMRDDDAPGIPGEHPLQQQARIRTLGADPEAWFRWYFPAFCTAAPAGFHLQATQRVLAQDEWYEVRAWSRELAKSTRTMMEVLYLALTGRKRNVLLVSNSLDNAVRLLQPYRAALEGNRRLLYDYGQQQQLGCWEAAAFTTRSGVAFRAIGAGQSPRGTRNAEARPDVILVDDIDTDEDVRNADTIRRRWDWVEQALIGTRSISSPLLVIFCGNIIAPYCCITEAMKRADHVDIVNIRDAQGHSSWPQKNSEEMIDRVLSRISYAAQQKEYFNNPVSEGAVFRQMAYKPALPLGDYELLVCYTDPSFRDTARSDYKATVLVGRWRDEFHVLRVFLEQATTAAMIGWHYELLHWLGGHSCWFYMEQVFLQDMILKEFYEEGARRGSTIPVMGDRRAKPGKYMRIESLLDPLHRHGKLWLNESEKHSPHMQRLHDQFLAFGPGSRAHDDGPDAVEGAVWILAQKAAALAAGGIRMYHRRPSSKRF